MQTPTLGRVVHYHDGYGHVSAAVIADVRPDGQLNLGVFSVNGNVTGKEGVPLLPEGEEPKRGVPCCTWPKRDGPDLTAEARKGFSS